MLINNAGFGTHGEFNTIEAQGEHQEVMLNVAAVVALSHRFLLGMAKSDHCLRSSDFGPCAWLSTLRIRSVGTWLSAYVSFAQTKKRRMDYFFQR